MGVQSITNSFQQEEKISWSDGSCRKFLDPAETFLLTGDSYRGGIIFTLDGKAFRIIENGELQLTLELVDFNLQKNGSLLISDGENYKKYNLQTVSSDENLPMPGLYIGKYQLDKHGHASDNYQLIEVTQRLEILEGTKITGDVFVPARKKTFYVDTSTKDARMRHAGGGFVNPFWNDNYILGFYNKTAIGIKKTDTYYLNSNMFYRISEFSCIVSNAKASQPDSE